MAKEMKDDGFWNKKAEFWSQNVREGMDVFRDLYSLPAFLAFIGDIRGKKVLDVGCGEGYNTRIFAEQGADVVGIDLSKEMIQLAQEEEKKTNLGIQYFAASWTDLSLFKNEFDIILSTMALMDGPGYEQALKEFHRVLKPGGDLFFSITHPCFLPPGYSKLTDENGMATHRVINNYSKEGPWEFTWQLSKKADKSDARSVTATSYHRMLSTYINNLLAAGFTLKEIGEPLPSEKACEQNPRLKVARDVAPSFLFVHATTV
jgi:ubiquinone/menaquinone biosynthesis C-methylase UbiE